MPYHVASWNLRGKNLENLADTADLLNLGGLDLIGLQELGGCMDIPSGQWDKKEVWLQQVSYSFVIGNPAGSHRCLAIGYPSTLIPHVAHISVHSLVGCV